MRYTVIGLVETDVPEMGSLGVLRIAAILEGEHTPRVAPADPETVFAPWWVHVTADDPHQAGERADAMFAARSAEAEEIPAAQVRPLDRVVGRDGILRMVTDHEVGGDDVLLRFTGEVGQYQVSRGQMLRVVRAGDTLCQPQAAEGGWRACCRLRM